MSYYTRVLSKDEEFPSFDELAHFVRAEHPEFKLTIEEGTEEEWESLLLSGIDDVEVAVDRAQSSLGWLARRGVRLPNSSRTRKMRNRRAVSRGS